MISYEARLPQDIAYEAQKYQELISNLRQTQDTEKLRNTGTYESLPEPNK